MSSSTYSSRAYRYRSHSRRQSSLLQKMLAYLCLTIVVTALSGTAYLLWKRNDLLALQLLEQGNAVQLLTDELSILRTLNPYHVGNNEILKQAVVNNDLFPGWITRVYPLPENKEKAAYLSDVGSFVLSETRFSLSSHQRYGISRPAKSMYRLNGLYPSKKAGRLQVGIEFYLKNNHNDRNSINNKTKICSCYARLEMNNKRIIDQKLNLLARFETEQVLTGETMINKGLYPISAMIYCDDRSDFQGDEVEVSISFRNTEQHSLTTSRYSVFHIYSPQNITASL